MDNNSSVKLIRVHYYDASKHFRNIPTISQNVYLQEQKFWKNKSKTNNIRRSIFGRKWILEINGIEDSDKTICHWNVFVVLIVALCFILAVLCGIYFSSYNSAVLKNMTIIEDSTNILSINNSVIKKFLNIDLNKHVTTKSTFKSNQHSVQTDISSFEYCTNCSRPTKVCLKLTPDGPPTCEESRDINDLTGCGGYCEINTQYCKLLDKKHLVYECLKDYYTLECLDGGFNCGNFCISNNKTCDGVIDCQNKSDELNCDCDLDNHFQCGDNISCLENVKKCDGKVDCWDARDEIGCSSDDCLPTELACIHGGCIHVDMFCDGLPNCEDKSDEPSGCEMITKPKLNSL